MQRTLFCEAAEASKDGAIAMSKGVLDQNVALQAKLQAEPA